MRILFHLFRFFTRKYPPHDRQPPRAELFEQLAGEGKRSRRARFCCSEGDGPASFKASPGRPSKLTPELKEEILTTIGKGGCTYVDACLKAGISTSTFQLWKQPGAGPGAIFGFSGRAKKGRG